MPKIIINAREEILKEAKRQLLENGYSATTIRSVAKATGIATGTVYNYFPSKDMLLASFMMEDWKEELSSVTYNSGDKREIIQGIYNAIISFSNKYENLFKDKEALTAFNSSLGDKHPILISQLASLVMDAMADKDDKEFIAAFIAESLLSYAMRGTDFDRRYGIIEKLL